MNKIENVTIGTDPELFIIDTSRNKIISSVGLIPGVKGAAWRSNDMPEGYGLQIDNILAEFNIPPVNNAEDFIHHINYMKNYIKQFVKKINPNYDILCIASQFVDEDQLQTPEAKLFGCSVDYNAYTRKPNEKPEGEATNLRSAGVHVHIGYDNPNIETSLQLVKYLDLTLGLPSVIIDSDVNRRTLYGKAGCFRITSYGVEYRVLSSLFIRDNQLIKFVYDGTMKAIALYNQQVSLPDSDNVRAAINNSNIELATAILKDYE